MSREENVKCSDSCGGEVVMDRVKNIEYDIGNRDRTISIYIEFCAECGDVKSIRW